LLFKCSQGNEFVGGAEKTAVFHSTGAVDFCSAKIISWHSSLEKMAFRGGKVVDTVVYTSKKLLRQGKSTLYWVFVAGFKSSM